MSTVRGPALQQLSGEGNATGALLRGSDGFHCQTRSRRDFLKLAGLLGVAVIAPGAHAAPLPSLDAPALALIGEVAELIIPTTDTGGAKAAGVPSFVDMMVSQWFAPDERDHFLKEMKAFDDGAVAKLGHPFMKLSDTEKHGWYGDQLTAKEHAATSSVLPIPDLAPATGPRSSFAVLMKRLTVIGYYTSELGSTEELSMTMVFDKFVGCAPVKADERAASFMPTNPSFSAY